MTHKYRSDVDGLRALAVASVVIFHAFSRLAPGGYVGVDVFFVISGYLITTNILTGLNAGTFTIHGFYQRRVRRIFPALVAMLAIVLAFGWFSLLAKEYRQLGKHVGAGAVFLSNIALWKESGYFDTAAAVKPLTHLWSLGIEEQFYIVWPLMLWAVVKLRLHVVVSAVVVASVSFGLGLAALSHDIAGAYYSPFNRFWELLVGAILAALLLRRARSDEASPLQHALAMTGLALVLVAIFGLDARSKFPGWAALAPTVGAALMIGAGEHTFTARRVFAQRPLVWIGLISFPLYLWHWPLLTFARIIASTVPPAPVRAGAVVLSVVLSWATYRYIEKPLRFHRRARLVTGALVASMIVVGLAGYATFKHGGIPGRAVVQMNPNLATGEDGGTRGWTQDSCGIRDPEAAKLFENCIQDNRGRARFALIGDSKAQALIGGLIRTSSENGRWLFIGHSGAVPVLSDAPMFAHVEKLARIAIDAVAHNPDIDVVVLEGAARVLFGIEDETSFAELPDRPYYDVVAEGYRASIRTLTSAGKLVVLYVDNPPLPKPEDCLQRRTTFGLLNRLLVRKNPACELPASTFAAQTAKYRALLERLKGEFPGQVEVFDATSVFCGSDDHICRHVRGGRFMYSYTDHPSDYAAGTIGLTLNPFLEWFAPRAADNAKERPPR